MSAFSTAVQDCVEAVRQQRHDDALVAFQAAMEQAPSANRQEAGTLLLDLAERLAGAPGQRYGGMLVCLCDACLGAGADPWIATGLIIERLHGALIDARRFQAACHRRLRDAGLAVDDAGDAADELRRSLADADAPAAAAWAELDLYCLAASGLLATFAEARQLFRRLPAIDGLPELAAERSGPAEVMRVLAAHPEEAVPAAGPAAVAMALARLEALVGSADAALAEPLQQLYQSLFCASQAARNDAVRGLAGLLARCAAAHVGDLAQSCGSLVETGSDPSPAIDVLYRRLRDVLPRAAHFVRQCVEAARRQGVNPDEEERANLVEAFAPLVGHGDPAGESAFLAAGTLCPGVIAHLARSLAARRRFRGDAPLLAVARELSSALSGAAFLTQMLQVLDDEELVVLAPEHRLGWRLRIGGIGDNFQLHTLLAGALVGPVEAGGYPGSVGVFGEGRQEERQPGRPLPPRAVGVARDLPCSPREPSVWSYLQLWNWPALQRDGRLPAQPLAHSDWFVWNEGVPADLLAFEGTRLLLIGPAPFSRSWNGGRIFHGMDARLDVVARLSADEVIDWMRRLSVAPHPPVPGSMA